MVRCPLPSLRKAKRPDRSAELERLFKQAMQIAIGLDRDLAAKHGLALTDLNCLGYLDRTGDPVSGKMIAEHVGLSTGATTALLDRLERAGLVQRRPNPSDRRGIAVELVEAKARPIFDEYQGMRDRLRAVFDGLSDRESDAVLHFLKSLVDQEETGFGHAEEAR